jgi:hypothetical protein
MFNHEASVIACTVRDFSPDGACLQVQSVAKIPDSFTLLVMPENIVWQCRVAWRSNGRIGVSFGAVQRAPRRPAAAAIMHSRRRNHRAEARAFS